MEPPRPAPGGRVKKGLLARVLEDGGPGYLQFAVTNRCNAACSFCGFARGRLAPRGLTSVTLAEGREAIGIAARNGIGYLAFVGGEPLLHPDLPDMVAACTAAGIRPLVVTHGGLWNDRNARELADAGLGQVIMSVDAPDASVHERNRGLPGLCETIRRANLLFDRLGVQTTASVTVSRLIGDFSRLPGFLASLAFRSVTFSYPLTALGSTYLSYSDSPVVSFSPEELIEAFEAIKRLKKEGAIHVVNPAESLTDLQRQLRGKVPRFPCLAGYKYFFLDWNLDLYRCHAWETPLCRIRDFDRSVLVRDGCTRCLIDCYRDPSVLQFAAVSLSDAFRSLRAGDLAGFARRLFDPRNAASLSAVREELRWIRRLR
jgi:MoaA/NifB/PqqE/SkfB family radical SAM enzyme